MAFKDYSRQGTCDFCEKETEVVVCSGGYGPVSNAYCETCHSGGLQPYDIMVAYIACAGRFPDDVNEGYVKDVRRILQKMQISEEKFVEDVDAAIEEMSGM